MVLFSLQRFKEAKILNDEVLKMVAKVRPDYIFKSKVLSAKIDFAFGYREKAVALLSEMLIQTKDKEEQADLHYELSLCGVDCEEDR